MTVHGDIDVVQHGDVVVQLVADLHAQLALARYAGAQPVELLVLLLQDPLVVRVDLHVVQLARLIPVPHRVVRRVVAVAAAEELGFEVRAARIVGRVVGEAHRFGNGAGVLGSEAGAGCCWGFLRRRMLEVGV